MILTVVAYCWNQQAACEVRVGGLGLRNEIIELVPHLRNDSSLLGKALIMGPNSSVGKALERWSRGLGFKSQFS